jgi:quercetin dioxygenase-like cupin family protein
MRLAVGIALVGGVALGLLGGRVLSAQGTTAQEGMKPDPLNLGTVLHRTELAGAAGMEAILVLRELPPGGEAGKHTQSGTEIVYVAQGSIIVEKQGQPPMTLNAGEAFSTVAGEVHNVKNASATEPGKAIVFYVASKGTTLEGLSKPAP